MTTIDLTISSDEESPPIASTSRSSNPTHFSQQPQISTQNRQNGINGGSSTSNRASGSGSGKNGRAGSNGNSSFSVGSSSSSQLQNSQSKGKGKAPVEIEISSDSDDDESRIEKLKAAAKRRRSSAAKKSTISKPPNQQRRPIKEITISSDDSDSDSPRQPRPAPPSTASQQNRPPSSTQTSQTPSLLQQARAAAQKVSDPSTPRKQDQSTTNRTSPSTSSTTRQLQPHVSSSTLDGNDGGAESTPRAATKSSKSSQTTSQAQLASASTSVRTPAQTKPASFQQDVDATPKKKDIIAGGAVTNKSESNGKGKGKEKAVDQDAAMDNDDEDEDTTLHSPAEYQTATEESPPRGKSPSRQNSHSPTPQQTSIPGSNIQHSSPTLVQGASLPTPPASSTSTTTTSNHTRPGSLPPKPPPPPPTSTNLPQKPPSVSQPKKASPASHPLPPRPNDSTSQTFSISQSDLPQKPPSISSTSLPAKSTSPSSAQQPLASSSKTSPTSNPHSLPQKPLPPSLPAKPTQKDDSEVLYLSSSSERGDSPNPPANDDSDSDLEILSSKTFVSIPPPPLPSTQSSSSRGSQFQIENDLLEELERQKAALLAKKKKIEQFREREKEREREREKAEREKVEKEKAEREKMEQEKMERERVERVKIERERREKEERLEIERLRKLEKERLERVESERVERERVEKERLERVERERLEAEEKAAREKAEAERLQQEKLEQERIEREKKEEEERIEKERIERERIEEERVEKEREEEIERKRLENLEKEEKLRLEEEEAEEQRRIQRQQEEEEAASIEAIRVYQEEQDREEAEQLDQFCEIDLPILQAETQAFRDTLREEFRDNWDDILGHLIASEGVSSKSEYEDKVEKAKAALTDCFEPQDWIQRVEDATTRTEEAVEETKEGSHEVTDGEQVERPVNPSDSAPQETVQAPVVAPSPSTTLLPKSIEAQPEMIARSAQASELEETDEFESSKSSRGPVGNRKETQEEVPTQGQTTQAQPQDSQPRPQTGEKQENGAVGESEVVEDSEQERTTASRKFAVSDSEAENDEEEPQVNDRSLSVSKQLQEDRQPSRSPLAASPHRPIAVDSTDSTTLPQPPVDRSTSDSAAPNIDSELKATTPPPEPPRRKKEKKSKKLSKTARKSTGQPVKPVQVSLRAVKSTNGGRIVPRPPMMASLSPSPDPLSLSVEEFAVETRRKREAARDDIEDQRRKKRSRRTGSIDSLEESGTSTPDSEKHSRTTLTVGGQDKDHLLETIEAPLIVTDKYKTDSKAHPEETDEEFFKRQQRLLPSHLRQIAGPSYDLHEEFPQTIQKSVADRERNWKKVHPHGKPPLRDGYKILYEEMIQDANSKEFAPGERPLIRVIPLKKSKPTDYSSPEFELCYTNRVIYAEGIAPDQAPGCGCEGDCGNPENRAGCACRKRQIAASTTRVGGAPRSGHQDFAYDANGILNEKLLAASDPIIECNSECGCDEDCINRVVGRKKPLSIDIYRTEDKGWGIRNPHSYVDPLIGSHHQRTIRRGEPLGVYAGELITAAEGELRDDLIYRKIGRCYTYSLDAWTVGEDYKALAPKVDADKMVVTSTDASHVTIPHGAARKSSKLNKQGKSSASTSKKNKQQKDSKLTPVIEEEEGEEDDDDGFTAIYNVDAFSYGNWTRFANHNCQDFNVTVRTVYVDEANVTRPLWVYVAHKDIKPGEEISISYFSESEPKLSDAGHISLREWQKQARQLSQEQPKNFRCYCGKPLCRGIMFKITDENVFFNRFEDD
ncbi:hypothetical protein JCM3765_003889 [Sporobolomyces pararoseus]